MTQFSHQLTRLLLVVANYPGVLPCLRPYACLVYMNSLVGRHQWWEIAVKAASSTQPTHSIPLNIYSGRTMLLVWEYRCFVSTVNAGGVCLLSSLRMSGHVLCIRAPTRGHTRKVPLPDVPYAPLLWYVAFEFYWCLRMKNSDKRPPPWPGRGILKRFR